MARSRKTAPCRTFSAALASASAVRPRGEFEAKSLQKLTTPRTHSESARIAPTAIVHPDSRVGERCAIAADAVVAQGAALGDDVEIGPGAYLGPNAVVGSGAVIGGKARVEHFAIVEANSRIGAGTTLAETPPGADGAQPARTTVREGSVLGDKCDLGPGAVVERRCELGDGVALGAGTTVESAAKIAYRFSVVDPAAVAQLRPGADMPALNVALPPDRAVVADPRVVPDDGAFVKRSAFADAAVPRECHVVLEARARSDLGVLADDALVSDLDVRLDHRALADGRAFVDLGGFVDGGAGVDPGLALAQFAGPSLGSVSVFQLVSVRGSGIGFHDGFRLRAARCFPVESMPPFPGEAVAAIPLFFLGLR